MLRRCFNHTAAGRVNLCLSYRIGEGDRSSSCAIAPWVLDESQSRFFTATALCERVYFCLAQRITSHHVFWGLSFVSYSHQIPFWAF